jgi:hypothetical protein
MIGAMILSAALAAVLSLAVAFDAQAEASRTPDPPQPPAREQAGPEDAKKPAVDASKKPGVDTPPAVVKNLRHPWGELPAPGPFANPHPHGR